MDYNWEVFRNVKGKALIISDMSDTSGGPTITNSAEKIVKELFERGWLEEGRRLFYFDTDNDLDEIIIKDGAFRGFAPGPKSGNAHDVE